MSDHALNTADALDSDHADIQKHVRVYMIVFGSLAVLTIATVAVAFLDLPIWPALIVALLIASVKGGLVAGYFMHLVSERKVIYWVLIVTAAFLVFMFLLFISSFHDQEGLHLVS